MSVVSVQAHCGLRLGTVACICMPQSDAALHAHRCWLLQAYRNMLGRFLEASGRGLWSADAQTLEQLKVQYGDIEDELEGAQ